ncbi:hypothetical protein VP01_1038g4 [Puccinia sorghi]|uniref:Uncharacterized protein n=1 Tax=Puccinia sorghi TaxID=27349 RepID=A0A0L6VVV7_9BASI|nr:hypothetical protein VP01_1038g4 [Puccinia sorghi]
MFGSKSRRTRGKFSNVTVINSYFILFYFIFLLSFLSVFLGVERRKTTNKKRNHVINQSSLDSLVSLPLNMPLFTKHLRSGTLRLTIPTTTILLLKILELMFKTAVLPQNMEGEIPSHWALCKQMNEYLHYFGLTSLQQTAIEALWSLTSHAKCHHMLKLMDESHNSSKGIGQVMEAIPPHTKRVLQDIQYPSNDPQHSLHNLIFQLVCLHTFWNITKTIFTANFGNSSNEDDL